MEAIVAVYRDWGIGKDGSQPIVIPEDRKRFQQLTEGGTIIVGRKTLEDFPGGKPLPNRTNIVLTHQEDLEIPGAIVVHSVEEVLELTKGKPNVYVCGGSSVYLQLLHHCTKIHLTRIEAMPKTDRIFLNLDNDFNWSLEYESPDYVHDGITYTFCEYEIYDPRRDYKKVPETSKLVER